MAFSAISMFAQGKFTVQATQQLQDAALTSRAASSSNGYLPLNVYTHSGYEAEQLTGRIEQLGGHVNVAAGTCVCATMPASEWQTVASWPEVRAIDVLSEGGGYLLDNAHKYVGADVVKDNTSAVKAGLPNSLNGEGTLAAIIDGGIDYGHSTFTGDDGKTRIVYAATLDMNDKGEFTVKSFTPDDINKGLKESDIETIETHGTITSGIIGGRGTSDGKYAGVASKAGLILIDINSAMNKAPGMDELVAKCINIVDSVAKSLGKPVSLNISLCGDYGPGDEYAIFNQAIEKFTGKGTLPGRSVTIATGNNADIPAHLSHTFDKAGTVRCILFKGNRLRRLVGRKFDIYCNDNKNISFKLILRDEKHNILSQSEEVNISNPTYTLWNANLSDSEYLMANITAELNAVNNRTQVQVRYNDASTYTKPNGYYIVEAEIKGMEGTHFTGYQYYGNQAYEIYGSEMWEDSLGVKLDADIKASFLKADNTQLSNPYTASPYVIAVGCGITTPTYGKGLATKLIDSPMFPEKDGVKQTVGYPVVWSNYNTDFNHPIPHIIAPGTMIVSAWNRYNDDYKDEEEGVTTLYYMDGTNPYHPVGGTSMAAPYVGGVAALMLQLNPQLTVTQICNYLTTTAMNIDMLKASKFPQAQYGAGFLNVKDAILAAANASGIETVCSDAGNGRTVKSVINGRVVITKANGETFTVAGTRIK